MSVRTNENLIRFLRHYLEGSAAEFACDLTDEELEAVFALAQSNDVAHLVGITLEPLPDKDRYKAFFKEEMKAMYRYEKLQRRYLQLCGLFEEHSIPYLPMKGAVIRCLYPEPWHRTSCDIDIMVLPEQVDRAVALIVEQLGYTRGQEEIYHDVSLYSDDNVHLELHFALDDRYLETEEFWTDTRPIRVGSAQLTVSPEMRLIAHIAHTARHFTERGCGIRPFVDFWVLEQKLTYDREKLEKLLESHGLSKFWALTQSLMACWFTEEAPGKLEMLAEQYILPGGVYGNMENAVSSRRAGGYSKIGYVLHRLFPPVSFMKLGYPSLEKWPWLLPLCWVHRAFGHLFGGNLKAVKAEFETNRRISSEKQADVDELMGALKLQ